MTIFDKITNPVIFAHRGASAHAPENTVEAIQLAEKHGAEGVEVDLKLTRDKRVIVFHDRMVNRTTNGKGSVKDFTLEEIKKLDAGSFFSAEFSNCKVPTLEEIIESLNEKMILNLELKNYATPGDDLPDLVAEIVHGYKIEDRVLFSSFNFRTLSRIKKLCPSSPVATLALPGLAGVLARSKVGKNFARGVVHPHFLDVNQKYVEKLHSAGFRVHTWTVNNEKKMRKLFSINIDGIFTDDPLKALRIREAG